MYLESLGDYVQIRLKNRNVLTKQPLHKLEKILPEGHFIRIHKSYLVAVDKIDAFSTEMIEISGQEIPIGRTFKKAVQERLSS